MIALGDFNAHLDKNTAKYCYHENSNTNRMLVVNFIQEFNLFVASAYIKEKLAELYTYPSGMSERKTKVDYIFVNKNSVHNCQAYKTVSCLKSNPRE